MDICLVETARKNADKLKVSIDTANALANCLLTGKTVDDLTMVDICKC